MLLAGAGWLLLRPAAIRNAHLEALISERLGVGCNDDTVRRGELAAAGGEALPFLLEKVQAQPDRVERLLRWAGDLGLIARLNDWVSEGLAQRLWRRGDQSERDRMGAMEILILLGPGAAASRSELGRLATSAPPLLRWKALAAVTAITPDEPATRSNFLSHLSLEGFQPPNAPPPGWSLDGIQSELARQFPRIWPTNPAPVEALLPLLDSKDSHVRLNAARALPFFGTAASNAAPRLVQMLSDPDRRVRPSAAHALGVVSPTHHGALAVSAMLAQQRTNDSWTGDYAYKLYGALGPIAQEAAPSLIEKMGRGPRRGHTGPVAFALWRIQGQATPEIVEALVRDLETPIQRFQRMSLLALKEIGPPASNAVPALRRMLSSRFATLQQEAREALKSIEGRAPGPAAQ